MIRIFDIASKDLTQILRDRKTFLFLLVMPIAFTFLFGFAFGGFSKKTPDPRLPVALINQDGSDLSLRLTSLLENSAVIVMKQDGKKTLSDYEKLLSKGDISGILVIPSAYSEALQAGSLPHLSLTVDLGQTSGMTIQNEVMAIASRLTSAVQTALIVGRTTSAFTPAFEQALSAWDNSPVRI